MELKRKSFSPIPYHIILAYYHLIPPKPHTYNPYPAILLSTWTHQCVSSLFPPSLSTLFFIISFGLFVDETLPFLRATLSPIGYWFRIHKSHESWEQLDSVEYERRTILHGGSSSSSSRKPWYYGLGIALLWLSVSYALSTSCTKERQ